MLPLNLTSGARFNWEKILLKILLKSSQKVKTKNSRNVKKSVVDTCLLFKLGFREDFQEIFFPIESGPCPVSSLTTWHDPSCFCLRLLLLCLSLCLFSAQNIRCSGKRERERAKSNLINERGTLFVGEKVHKTIYYFVSWLRSADLN